MEVQVYNHLLNNISETYTHGKIKAFNAVNIALVETYWKIGQYIVEFEQEGKAKQNMERRCWRDYQKTFL